MHENEVNCYYITLHYNIHYASPVPFFITIQNKKPQPNQMHCDITIRKLYKVHCMDKGLLISDHNNITPDLLALWCYNNVLFLRICGRLDTLFRSGADVRRGALGYKIHPSPSQGYSVWLSLELFHTDLWNNCPVFMKLIWCIQTVVCFPNLKKDHILVSWAAYRSCYMIVKGQYKLYSIESVQTAPKTVHGPLMRVVFYYNI